MAKGSKFNSPFAELGKVKKQLEAEAAAKAAPPPPPPKRRAPEEEDTRSFAEIMGSAPIPQDPRGKKLTRVETPPRASEEDAEAWVELASLVDGDGRFDFDDSDEQLEGAVVGLDRRILRSLRRGDYPIGATLDLHGLRRDAAEAAVERFVGDARERGLRAVRIVHGKGTGSEDGVPVLRPLMRGWLERGRARRHILAFTSARPQDGGAGAVVLLLRR